MKHPQKSCRLFPPCVSVSASRPEQIVDEADTMFDEGFGPEVEKLIDPVMRNGGQVVFVTATLSKARRGEAR